MKKEGVFLIFVLTLLSLSLVSADVGLGVSPSKMRQQIVSGDTYEYQFYVFNTGDNLMDVSLNIKGDIAEFSTVSPVDSSISPEPKPHELPLKNAKLFTLTVDAPNVRNQEIYSGTFSAIGGGSKESKFGGSVGVSSQIEFVVIPKEGFLAKLTKTHYIIVGVLLGLIALILIFKKLGIKIQFAQTNSKKKIKKKRR